MRIHHPSKKNERGVTILIVAISLLVLITMAALAIDIASLYEARTEAQRAADAAALAGARMFVTSSYTSTTSLDFSDVCNTGGPGSTVAVNKQAEAAAKVNSIAGQSAVITNVQCNNTNVGNPRVTVTVESATSPTFFSKIWQIWGSGVGTVKATATAEAYNASGQTLPIMLTDVKPWLIPNCNPNGSTGPCAGYFVNSNGTIANSGSFIGNTISLDRIFHGPGTGSGGTLQYYSLIYPNSPAPVCPAANAICGDAVTSSDPYIHNIACASRLQFRCGEPIGQGQTFQPESVDVPTTPTRIGTRCLIHEDENTDGLGNGQDSFTPAGTPPLGAPPVAITGGYNNPNPGLQGVANIISRSDSIVTVPLYNGQSLCTSPGNCSTTPTPVIGFLQLGITQTTPGPAVEAVILNVMGCGSVPFPPLPASMISGGGSSPIPVRLVQNP